MTIDEQLQFSVLTAPVAAQDRRALSQAWYSALYGSRGEKAAPARTYASPQRSAAAIGALRAAPVTAGHPQRGAKVLPLHAGDVKREGAAPVERRAVRSPLARKIERVLLRPRPQARKSAVTIESAHGRVHVLLQTRGAQLKLIAICPPKARTDVAAALAQARYALALRGIGVDAETREAVQC
jgi:hypothetical protein